VLVRLIGIVNTVEEIAVPSLSASEGVIGEKPVKLLFFILATADILFLFLFFNLLFQ